MARHKSLGLWLAALALWVQLLLPAMLCPDAAQPAEDHSLCVAGSHAPAHHDDAPLHKGCPACLSVQALHGGFVPPTAVTLKSNFPYVIVVAVVTHNSTPHRPARATPQPRGPPLHV
jgi:hypothetical protein